MLAEAVGQNYPFAPAASFLYFAFLFEQVFVQPYYLFLMLAANLIYEHHILHRPKQQDKSPFQLYSHIYSYLVY